LSLSSIFETNHNLKIPKSIFEIILTHETLRDTIKTAIQQGEEGLYPPMDEILEPKQVADMLKVHHRTIIRWAEQGKIPGFKLGDLWRFRREAIEEFIRKEEQRYAGKKED